ncbi:Syntaxin-binding protein 1 [Amphibalanus amphitrite]|uniref:Syntaxin-binding protein 1 n=1 Tax=Amphibalanus amphitrite TaxID=1232801 RepID=A0A6A4VRT5_AMPAM|nr:Syntaxin-binding protein 1 [Amphibalanus amphitrite]
MALKTVVGQKILELVRAARRPSGAPDWRVLIVDELCMRMVSACCKMHDLAQEGVTIVEDLRKRREPLPHLEAVYLVQPTERSIRALLADWSTGGRPMYRAAHILFSEPCPDGLFELLAGAGVSRHVRTLKEVNMAFVPLEALLYSLDAPRTLPAVLSGGGGAQLDRLAEQLATLCATLGEYPAVRYRDHCAHNEQLARLLQARLDAHKADEPTMGQGAEKTLYRSGVVPKPYPKQE